MKLLLPPPDQIPPPHPGSQNEQMVIPNQGLWGSQKVRCFFLPTHLVFGGFLFYVYRIILYTYTFLLDLDPFGCSYMFKSVCSSISGSISPTRQQRPRLHRLGVPCETSRGCFGNWSGWNGPRNIFKRGLEDMFPLTKCSGSTMSRERVSVYCLHTHLRCVWNYIISPCCIKLHSENDG